jgi:putative adenylate-forming enzyme
MEITPIAQEEHQPLADYSTCVQHERWTRQQLEEYQANALHACRSYAYAHSPFYQHFHRELMGRPLHELPVLTKATVMEHFDELVTDREVHLRDVRQYLTGTDQTKLFLDRYRVTVTSGSTGQPGVFLNNPIEAAVVANTLTRVRFWGDIAPQSRVAAVTSPLPGHITAQFPVLVINGQQVPYLQLSTTVPPEALVEHLNEWQPDVLFAYPSIASILTDEQRQGRLHISLRMICCGGETLTEEMRRRIEESWQVKIFNTYGATESGPLAQECSFHMGLHLFEDFTIVEVVDENNHPVPPGQVGAKVLLTVLYRRTQPLIRYEVTDMVRVSTREPCPCGRPFAQLEAVVGRAGEGLHFQTLTGKEEEVSTLQFETIFDPLPISGWQIVQQADGLHIFLLGALLEELRNEQVLDALREFLTRRGLVIPTIEIHRTTDLAKNAAGKTPALILREKRSAS